MIFGTFVCIKLNFLRWYIQRGKQPEKNRAHTVTDFEKKVGDRMYSQLQNQVFFSSASVWILYKFVEKPTIEILKILKRQHRTKEIKPKEKRKYSAECTLWSMPMRSVTHNALVGIFSAVFHLLPLLFSFRDLLSIYAAIFDTFSKFKIGSHRSPTFQSPFFSSFFSVFAFVLSS